MHLGINGQTDVPERVASGGVVVRFHDEQIFVALTREGDMEEYVLPKGGVEAGEDLLKAAYREIKEETGLTDLTLVNKLEVVERLTYDKDFWAVIHLYLFHTEQIEATPTDTVYHYEMKWFPLDRLPDFLWPEQKALLERHQEDIAREIKAISDMNRRKSTVNRGVNVIVFNDDETKVLASKKTRLPYLDLAGRTYRIWRVLGGGRHSRGIRGNRLQDRSLPTCG